MQLGIEAIAIRSSTDTGILLIDNLDKTKIQTSVKRYVPDQKSWLLERESN